MPMSCVPSIRTIPSMSPVNRSIVCGPNGFKPFRYVRLKSRISGRHPYGMPRHQIERWDSSTFAIGARWSSIRLNRQLVSSLLSCAIFLLVFLFLSCCIFRNIIGSDKNWNFLFLVQVFSPGDHQASLLKMVTRQALKRKQTNREQSPVIVQDAAILKKRPKPWWRCFSSIQREHACSVHLFSLFFIHSCFWIMNRFKQKSSFVCQQLSKNAESNMTMRRHQFYPHRYLANTVSPW